MPNRILRDYTDSEAMAKISAHAERLFIRLIQKADDYGNYHANPTLLRSGCFPLMLDTVREADISRDLAACEKAGLIALYEVSGKKLLNIKNFNQRMRNSRPRFPLPSWQQDDGVKTDNVVTTRGKSPRVAASRGKSRPESETDSETDSETKECVSAGAGEGRRKVEIVEGIPDPSPAQIEYDERQAMESMQLEEEFNAWYAAYPKQTDRFEASRQWLLSKAIRPPLEAMLEALEAQKISEQWQRQDGRFIPNPYAYLAGQKWQDKLPSSKKLAPSPYDF